MIVKGSLALLILLAAVPAEARDKAEINVTNLREEPITMRFSYAFRNYHFTLMEHDISVGDDVSYRFPVGLPGCERLQAWGLADAMVTLLRKGSVVCERPVSLCDRRLLWGEARADRCTWREMRPTLP